MSARAGGHPEFLRGELAAVLEAIQRDPRARRGVLAPRRALQLSFEPDRAERDWNDSTAQRAAERELAGVYAVEMACLLRHAADAELSKDPADSCALLAVADWWWGALREALECARADGLIWPRGVRACLHALEGGRARRPSAAALARAARRLDEGFEGRELWARCLWRSGRRAAACALWAAELSARASTSPGGRGERACAARLLRGLRASEQADRARALARAGQALWRRPGCAPSQGRWSA